MARGAGGQRSEAELLAELEALYREVDALYAGAQCELSSECCRFGITGREPQVTSLELALVRRALKARGGPLGEKKRALPLTQNADKERVCPLLAQGSRCSVYKARPLGCRTFFCGRAQLLEKPSREALQDAVRRLQTLAAEHATGGERPHALTRVL
jgi:Fe-S-cluster containining protein